MNISKNIQIIFFLIFGGLTSYAQSDSISSIYNNLDTLKSYKVFLKSETNNIDNSSKYWVNKKIVDKKTYSKYKKGSDNMDNCKPCYLVTYDINENIVYEGVRYTDCQVGIWIEYYPNGKIKLIGHYKENDTNNWENASKRGYCSNIHGTWTYFDIKGDALYTEIWDNGKFLKQIPEQNKAEIWDVGLYLEKELEDSIQITITEIKNLRIVPKYKNSNKDSKITIKFRVSAIGYKIVMKEYTLSSFKKIDVISMLKKAGIPKNKKASFELRVYCDGVYFKGFDLNVKR